MTIDINLITYLFILVMVFNDIGIIPPIQPGEGGVSRKRSPYCIDISFFFSTFGYTPERCDLLKGLLSYRSELYRIGIKNGFQWINGSFTSHVEILEKRPPSDIDVVTFYELPQNETQETLFQKSEVFKHDFSKSNFSIDSYFVEINKNYKKADIREVSYWYSIWSHTKQKIWKGFVEIDLNEDSDSILLAKLQTNENEHSNLGERV